MPTDTSAVTDLQAAAGVASVTPDQTRDAGAAPGDPSYADQWSLPKIGWDQVYGSVQPKRDAIVAVLDTGVDASNPDLANKLVAGTSILDGSAGTTDPNGHGTAMAGIIAAVTNNDLGIAGIGFAGVKVMPVTVLDSSGSGQDSDIISGVVYAADHGADVVSMSFSNPGYSAALQAAIDYAWSKNVVIVAATGNDGTSAASFPAGDRGVIGVSNTDQNDALNTTSNFGADTFLAAPGTDIVTLAAGGNVTTVTGTSASAAEVAAAAALLRASEPAAGLANGVIVSRLARNADAAGTAAQTGNGRLNLARAIADTSTTSVQPAGAAPLGSGGPFVGPYVAAQLGSETVGTQSPATVTRGSQATYTITIVNDSNTAATDVGNFRITTGVTGTTFAFSPACVTIPSNRGSSTVTLTANTSGTTPIGSTGFTLSLDRYSTSNASCGTFQHTYTGITGTLVAAAPAATKLVYTTTAFSVAAGVTSGTVTVQRQNAGGTAITADSTITVNLTSSSGTGLFKDNATGTTTITSVTIPNGQSSASFKYVDTTPGSPVLTAASAPLTSGTQAETITAGAVSASTSTVAASPTSVVADGSTTSTITVTLKDAGGNPVSGKTVTLAKTSGPGTPTISPASGASNASGVVTFTVKSTTAGADVFTATDTTDTIAITATATVTFTAGAVSASTSTVAASPTSVVADGSTTSTITVTLKDAGGNPVSGKTVTLAKTSGPGTPTISPASGASNASGVVTFTVKSTTAGADVFTATDTTDTIAITATATVTFTTGAVSASTSTVAASPTSVVADGSTTSTITVTLKDAGGNPVSGKTVTLAKTSGPGTPTISPASGASNASGVVTFTVKSTTAGADVFTATDTTDTIAITATATVTFTTGSADAGQTVIKARAP